MHKNYRRKDRWNHKKEDGYCGTSAKWYKQRFWNHVRAVCKKELGAGLEPAFIAKVQPKLIPKLIPSGFPSTH